MSHEPRELTLLSGAHQALVEARTLDEVRQLQAQADVVRAYAKKAKLGQNIVIEAAAIKLQADRRLGELLEELPLANAAPGNQYTGSLDQSHVTTGPVRLRDLGITKSESSRTQRLAKLPAKVFDAYIERNRALGLEPSATALLRLAERHQPANVIDVSCWPSGDVFDRLRDLVDTGRKFGTIYADPPWRFENVVSRGAAERHYPTLTVEQICAEPVSELCADQAHLHLWTTSTHLFQAFRVIEAWGFQYKTCFVWAKPEMGTGNYWRMSHELLLLGVRGQLTFRDKGQRSWLEHPRLAHSEKPEAVRQIIEQVSAPPYLEMYARKSPPNNQWTVYGDQVVPREISGDAIQHNGAVDEPA